MMSRNFLRPKSERNISARPFPREVSRYTAPGYSTRKGRDKFLSGIRNNIFQDLTRPCLTPSCCIFLRTKRQDAENLRVDGSSTEARSLQKGRSYLECVNQSATYVCSVFNIIFIIKDGEINGDTPVLVNSRQVICQVKGIFIEIGIVDWVIKPGKP